MAQESYTIDHYIRQPDDTWNLSIADRLDSVITLPSIGCTLALADVYRRINPDETAT